MYLYSASTAIPALMRLRAEAFRTLHTRRGDRVNKLRTIEAYKLIQQPKVAAASVYI